MPTAYAREDHGKAIYCVTFCDILPTYERVFAAVGGNRVCQCLRQWSPVTGATTVVLPLSVPDSRN